MSHKILNELRRFENEKGIAANALILGVNVIYEVCLETHIFYRDLTTNIFYMYGCKVFIDYDNKQNITAALI